MGRKDVSATETIEKNKMMNKEGNSVSGKDVSADETIQTTKQGQQNKEADFVRLMTAYRLQAFVEKLQQEGYYTVDDGQHIKSDELKELGMRAGHVRAFQRLVVEWKELQNFRKS